MKLEFLLYKLGANSIVNLSIFKFNCSLNLELLNEYTAVARTHWTKLCAAVCIILFISNKAAENCTFKIREIYIKDLTGYFCVIYIFLYSIFMLLNTKLVCYFCLLVQKGNRIIYCHVRIL